MDRLDQTNVNILVVDDDHSLAETFAQGLQKAFGEAIHVDVCFSGAQAYSLFAQSSYDLVISDFNMPDMSGMELFKQFQRNRSSTALVMCTAYGSDELEQEARQLVDAYLTKPFDLQILLRFVGHLGRFEMEKQTERRVTALILEDDIDLNRFMNKVLVNAGLETFQVFNIQEASNHLELNPFDVLIADVRVPDGSGIDLVRKYRSRLTQNGTTVIIVTGEVRYRYLEEELGVDMYLEKPVAVQELLTLVQRLTISSKEKST